MIIIKRGCFFAVPFYSPKKLVLIYGSLREVGGNLPI